jgi:hypothetical protein
MAVLAAGCSAFLVFHNSMLLTGSAPSTQCRLRCPVHSVSFVSEGWVCPVQNCLCNKRQLPFSSSNGVDSVAGAWAVSNLNCTS